MPMAASGAAGAAEDRDKQQNKYLEAKKKPDSNGKRKEPSSDRRNAGKEEKQQQKQQHHLHQHQDQGAMKKKKKKAFIYGNYNNYYGYRIDRNVKEDPRLAVFKREWFEEKDVLDIGCNQGVITINLAIKFFCRTIIGVDIDKGLIDTAYWNLRKIARKESGSSSSARVSSIQDSKCLNSLEDNVCPASSGETSKPEASHPIAEDLSKRVSFLHENFVESLLGCSEKYDTVLCLSVTKWVHLNWGDNGLITLFVKIWRLLRPGGILILEPQPWSSYVNNRLVSEVAKANYKEINLKPDAFREILLDKIGFRSAEVITDNLSGTVAGFDRPIIVFSK